MTITQKGQVLFRAQVDSSNQRMVSVDVLNLGPSYIYLESIEYFTYNNSDFFSINMVLLPGTWQNIWIEGEVLNNIEGNNFMGINLQNDKEFKLNFNVRTQEYSEVRFSYSVNYITHVLEREEMDYWGNVKIDTSFVNYLKLVSSNVFSN